MPGRTVAADARLEGFALLRTIRLVAAIAAAAALVAPAGRAAGDCSPASDWPSANSGYAAEVVALVNDHRSSLGLGSLQVPSSLAAAAVWKARHMAEYAYMQHDDPAPPVARSVGSRLSACGYGGGTWGENIAYGYSSPQAVVNGWLDSPGHRANIENPAYTAIGVGAAGSDSGTIYWAQDFGVSGSGSPPPQPDPPAEDPPAQDPPPIGTGEPPLPEVAPTGVPAPDAPSGGDAPATEDLGNGGEPAPGQESGEPGEPLTPASVRAGAGNRRSGAVSSLAFDDGRLLVVRATGPRTTWRATVVGVPNDLDALRVAYRSSSSVSCRQVLDLWSFQRRTWVPVISRMVGTDEVGMRALVTRHPEEYVSRSSGDGAVRLRGKCTRAGSGPLTSRADVLTVAFSTA
jgi:uncharacterized protein YkwD